VLGETEDCNDVSGKWHNEWTLDMWVESPNFRWLRVTILPMVVKEPAKYPQQDQPDASRVRLLQEETNESAPPSAPPPQKALLFCPVSGQGHHLKWWLKNVFADHVDIFHMYAEMGNDERTEMQLKFQDSQNPSLFITTPNVGGTGINLTAACHEV
jgi:SNF2 family DNA or RNA helicase